MTSRRDVIIGVVILISSFYFGSKRRNHVEAIADARILSFDTNTAASDLNSPRLKKERTKAMLAVNLGVTHIKLENPGLKIKFTPVHTECLVGDIDVMLMKLRNNTNSKLLISLESFSSNRRKQSSIKIKDFVGEIPITMQASDFQEKEVVGLFICQASDNKSCRHGTAIDHQKEYLNYLKNSSDSTPSTDIYYYQTLLISEGHVGIIDPQIFNHFPRQEMITRLKSYLEADEVLGVSSADLDRIAELNLAVDSIAPIIDKNGLTLPLPFNSQNCSFPGSQQLKADLAGAR